MAHIPPSQDPLPRMMTLLVTCTPPICMALLSNLPRSLSFCVLSPRNVVVRPAVRGSGRPPVSCLPFEVAREGSLRIFVAPLFCVRSGRTSFCVSIHSYGSRLSFPPPHPPSATGCYHFCRCYSRPISTCSPPQPVFLLSTIAAWLTRGSGSAASS